MNTQQLIELKSLDQQLASDAIHNFKQCFTEDGSLVVYIDFIFTNETHNKVLSNELVRIYRKAFNEIFCALSLLYPKPHQDFTEEQIDQATSNATNIVRNILNGTHDFNKFLETEDTMRKIETGDASALVILTLYLVVESKQNYLHSSAMLHKFVKETGRFTPLNING